MIEFATASPSARPNIANSHSIFVSFVCATYSQVLRVVFHLHARQYSNSQQIGEAVLALESDLNAVYCVSVLSAGKA